MAGSSPSGQRTTREASPRSALSPPKTSSPWRPPRPVSGIGSWVQTGVSTPSATRRSTAPTPGRGLTAPIVGIAPTVDGLGYWLVGSDGNVYRHGDAILSGTLLGQPLDAPIVGIAASAKGGYWLAGGDGGTFAFGNAESGFGNVRTRGISLAQPIVSMTPTPTGNGYLLVARDGGVFPFGDAPFSGSAAAFDTGNKVVGIATPPGGGYWVATCEGSTYAFGTTYLGNFPTSACRAPSTPAATSPTPGAALFTDQAVTFAVKSTDPAGLALQYSFVVTRADGMRLHVADGWGSGTRTVSAGVFGPGVYAWYAVARNSAGVESPVPPLPLSFSEAVRVTTKPPGTAGSVITNPPVLPPTYQLSTPVLTVNSLTPAINGPILLNAKVDFCDCEYRVSVWDAVSGSESAPLNDAGWTRTSRPGLYWVGPQNIVMDFTQPAADPPYLSVNHAYLWSFQYRIRGSQTASANSYGPGILIQPAQALIDTGDLGAASSIEPGLGLCLDSQLAIAGPGLEEIWKYFQDNLIDIAHTFGIPQITIDLAVALGQTSHLQVLIVRAAVGFFVAALTAAGEYVSDGTGICFIEFDQPNGNGRFGAVAYNEKLWGVNASLSIVGMVSSASTFHEFSPGEPLRLGRISRRDRLALLGIWSTAPH